MKTPILTLATGLLLAAGPRLVPAAAAPAPASTADKELADYFRAETTRLSERCLTDIRTLEDWTTHREQYRRQLLEMLGLSPLPEKSDLKPVVTGKIDRESLTVENLHFQSLPGLYVTANLYLPKNLARPAPAILYVCGHGGVMSNNVSYGNKVSYQHHGAWFARNGYVCLVIDTVQLGEILGLHHGTYREEMWWWNSRGYTPAGVEAWNSMRALDYLCTRPEVDTNRFGITGRSGGGAYSWFTAALDDRIKVAAPVAGITDLQNHVVDGTVEGHCDCMFFLNTYRWDYPLLAALCAPRPLLLVNSDTDSIFPLDGVLRTQAKVKRVYDLHRAANQFGLVLGPGPHKDVQGLQVPVFSWFNKQLKGEEPIIEMAATKLFTPQQLKVLDKIPPDAINTNIQNSFVAPARAPALPRSATAWAEQRSPWLVGLREKVFAGWPENTAPVRLEKQFSVQNNGLRFEAFDFESQPHVPLRLYTLQRLQLDRPDRVVLTLVGQGANRSNLAPAGTADGDRQDACPAFARWVGVMRAGFEEPLRAELAMLTPQPPAGATAFAALRQELETNSVGLAWLAPRGLGLSAWTGDARKQTQIRRRFMLLGQTLDGMRVWDIRRGVQAAQSVPGWRTARLSLRAEGDLACDALYASVFEPGLVSLELWRLPASHQSGPDLLNVLRILDVPQALALALERCPVRLHSQDAQPWAYARQVARLLEGQGNWLQVEP
jgi:dienelactone hydrolase